MQSRPPPGSLLTRLLDSPVLPGRLIRIGVRPARRAAIIATEMAQFTAGRGIVGDRYATRTDGARQATLIAAEDIAAIAAFLGRADLDPTLLRRNLVTRGINLVALKGRRFRVGTAVLEGTGDCAPCRRMEELLGPGGYNAVRSHGGLTARIIESGEARIGDAVTRLDIS